MQGNQEVGRMVRGQARGQRGRAVASRVGLVGKGDGNVILTAQDMCPAVRRLPVAIVFPRRGGTGDQYGLQRVPPKSRVKNATICTMNPTTSTLATSFRHARPQQLADALQDARNYTLSLF
ncbi:hypothetical protein LP419_03415 [Massilia sp. H-1]|nr:hypothetical protein LP419_03415 [Massilia sp. H-1]